MKNSAAAKGKLFTSAVRILDVILFSKNAENFFQVYDVPENLQAVLIRPFLDDWQG